jgi:L-iditol 2-dehydrogenase
MRGHPLIKPPVVLGHEVSGEVAESKSDYFKTGQRVAVAPYVPCGRCYFCQREEFTMCSDLFVNSIDPGGFSEYIRVPEKIVEKGMFEFPAELSFSQAALTEPLSCCINGIERSGMKVGDCVLVIGDGPIGLMLAHLSKVFGAGVVVSGMIDERLKIAGKIADCVIDVREEDISQYIEEKRGGIGFDIVFIAAGIPELVDTALQCVRKGGYVNIFGGLPGGSKFSVDLNQIHYQQVVMDGSFGFMPRQFYLSLELLIKKSIDANLFITHSVKIDDIETAFNRSANREGLKWVAIL